MEQQTDSKLGKEYNKAVCCQPAYLTYIQGLSRRPSGKEPTYQCRRHGFNPWVGKIPLEEEMATHSSILAWEISWTEEPGGLQSMGSQKNWT